MAVGPWQFTNTARTKILAGQLATGDTYKVALFTSVTDLSVASTSYASVTGEVAEANGYLTGGQAVAFTVTGTTVVDVAFTDNPSWMAGPGNIVARYAAIYEVGGDVLAFCLLDDTPADVTVVSGSVLAIDSDGTPEPVFEVA